MYMVNLRKSYWHDHYTLAAQLNRYAIKIIIKNVTNLSNW